MKVTAQPGRVMVLGPVGVAIGSSTVMPQSPANRALLGALAAADGQPIRSGGLARLLGHAQPDSDAARTAVQVAVHRLRRWLAENVGDSPSITTSDAGYALQADPLDTDVRHFRALVARATALTGRQRADVLHQALRLWRGEPLADVPSDRQDFELVSNLERERVRAARLFAITAIAHGLAERAAELLSPLTKRDPLDEQTHALLIRALAAAGRPGEALSAYEGIRDALRAELDVDPGPDLEEARTGVLRPAGADDVGAVPATLDMLPPAPDCFTGRVELLGRLRELVESWANGRQASIAAISGRPGVGKTALALQTAHALRAAFPGGCVYVDLRGAEATPRDPHEVVDRLLRSLGVLPESIPDGREERAALYRSRLADTGTLVLLDNAADENQVRALLPGVGCLVLTTSRSRLTALAGAAHVELDSLSQSEALDLLAGVVGRDRLAGRDMEANELAQQCGRLPLALRIAAAQLAANPHWTLNHVVDRLRDERRRLEQLSFDHLDVRASFNSAYVGLNDEARRLFGVLAQLELVDFPAWVGLAALDLPAGPALALDRLVEARLVDVGGIDGLGQVRLVLHDLVRLFGRERVEVEQSDPREALNRVFDGWLYLSQQANQKVAMPPAFDLPAILARPASIGAAQAERLLAEPARFLSTEIDCLVRATVQASVIDHSPTCWLSALSLTYHFETTCGWTEWQRTNEVALAAARRVGDSKGEAICLYGLGSCLLDRRQNSAAIEVFYQAAAAFQGADDATGEAELQRLLAMSLRRAGQLDAAQTSTLRALALFETQPDTGTEQSFMWWNLGWINMQRRRFDEARPELARAMELAEDSFPLQRGAVLHGFAMLEYWAGRHEASIEWCERELDLWRTLRVERGAAYALLCLGQNLTMVGRYDDARVTLYDAFALMERFTMVDGLGQTLTAFATLHRLTGDPETSFDMMGRAIEFCEQVESPTHTGEAWLELAEVHEALDQPAEARQARQRALPLFDQMGSSIADEIRSRLN